MHHFFDFTTTDVTGHVFDRTNRSCHSCKAAREAGWRKGWDSNPRWVYPTLDFESSALNRTQPPFLFATVDTAQRAA